MPFKFNPLTGNLDLVIPANAAGDLWSDVVDANIIPDSSGARDIGSSTLLMREIWAEGIKPVTTFIMEGTNARGRISHNTTLPDSTTAGCFIKSEDSETDTFGIYTDNQGSNNSTSTASILIGTGNKTHASASGGTGKVHLRPGVPSGSGTPGMVHVDGGLQLTTTSIATTYTALTSDNIILCDASSAAFTVTLPPSSGLGGKIYTIKKTDSDFAKAVTIDGNASETIDGATTTTLDTEGESIKIVSDGTNWEILERHIPSEWTAYTPTLTGFGTPTTVEFVWKRSGDTLKVRGRFTAGTPTAVEARASLPTGLTSAGTGKIPSIQLAGYSSFSAAFAGSGTMLAEPSVTYMTFGTQSASTGGFGKLNGSTLISSSASMSLTIEIPITGWNA